MRNGKEKSSSAGLPSAAGDIRYDRLEAARREVERSPLLGAHVRRHQYLHYLYSVVESEGRLLTSPECVHEMPVLRFVSVGCSFLRDDGHHPDFRVLLLDQILA